MRVKKFEVRGLENGALVVVRFANRKNAIKYGLLLTEYEVYDVEARVYVAGNTTLCRQLLRDEKPEVKERLDLRWRVTGNRLGKPAGEWWFATLKEADERAKHLHKYEVYDSKTSEYVGGNSQFYKNYVRREAERLFR